MNLPKTKKEFLKIVGENLFIIVLSPICKKFRKFEIILYFFYFMGKLRINFIKFY